MESHKEGTIFPPPPPSLSLNQSLSIQNNGQQNQFHPLYLRRCRKKMFGNLLCTGKLQFQPFNRRKYIWDLATCVICMGIDKSNFNKGWKKKRKLCNRNKAFISPPFQECYDDFKTILGRRAGVSANLPSLRNGFLWELRFSAHSIFSAGLSELQLANYRLLLEVLMMFLITKWLCTVPKD